MKTKGLSKYKASLTEKPFIISGPIQTTAATPVLKIKKMKIKYRNVADLS